MLGTNVTIGADVEIGANVVIHDDTVIGDGCVIQDNVVLGKAPRLSARSTARRDPLPGLVLGAGAAVCSGAIVYAGSTVGPKAIIGDLASVRERCVIGEGVVVGRGVCVENDTSIGAFCKIQSNSYITAYSTLEDHVFIAPCVTTTNDNFMGRTEERHAHPRRDHPPWRACRWWRRDPPGHRDRRRGLRGSRRAGDPRRSGQATGGRTAGEGVAGRAAGGVRRRAVTRPATVRGTRRPPGHYRFPVTDDQWLDARTFAGADFDPEALVAAKRAGETTVSVCLPALNVSDTIGPIVAAIRECWMDDVPLVDELVVIDSRSTDDTASVAAAAGARVVQDRAILPECGSSHGKGEAMWKSLAATEGDIIAWVDADLTEFRPAYIPGLLGPC